MTYFIYIKTFDGDVSPVIKTPDEAIAKEAFNEVVNRVVHDGSKKAAVLTYENRQIAFHWFDRKAGDVHFWRDRIDEIPWPTGLARRTSEKRDGRRVQVYLDSNSVEIANKLGNGNVSEGIRKALKSMSELKVNLK